MARSTDLDTTNFFNRINENPESKHTDTKSNSLNSLWTVLVLTAFVIFSAITSNDLFEVAGDSFMKTQINAPNNSRSQKNYRLYSGWKRDSKDHRDLRYTPRRKATRRVVDLRSFCPSVYNQSKLGSCVFNSVGFGVHFDELKQRLLDAFMPSRLFMYYNARVMAGTVNVDSGSEVRTGIKTVAKQGFCPETMWPYHI
jgi:hypothetical protein